MKPFLTIKYATKCQKNPSLASMTNYQVSSSFDLSSLKQQKSPTFRQGPLSPRKGFSHTLLHFLPKFQNFIFCHTPDSQSACLFWRTHAWILFCPFFSFFQKKFIFLLTAFSFSPVIHSLRFIIPAVDVFHKKGVSTYLRCVHYTYTLLSVFNA